MFFKLQIFIYNPSVSQKINLVGHENFKKQWKENIWYHMIRVSTVLSDFHICYMYVFGLWCKMYSLMWIMLFKSLKNTAAIGISVNGQPFGGKHPKST